MSGLKPCPFCGFPAQRLDLEDGNYQGGSCIECTGCRASSPVEFGRKENLVSFWNRRIGEEATASLDGISDFPPGTPPAVQVLLVTFDQIAEKHSIGIAVSALASLVEAARQDYGEEFMPLLINQIKALHKYFAAQADNRGAVN